MPGEDEPIELNISPDKVRDIVLKAREYAQLDDDEDDDELTDTPLVTHEREEVLDEGEDPTESELHELIADLNEDEVVDLIALVWVGRGDFTRAEWDQAQTLARDRRQSDSAPYLMGMPSLADYIQEGMAELGHDPEELEAG